MTQPDPIPNDGADIWALLIAEHADASPELLAHMRARRVLGIERYGTALQAGNGRDVLRDLLEELLDGMAYARQAHAEQDVPYSWMEQMAYDLARFAQRVILATEERGEALAPVAPPTPKPAPAVTPGLPTTPTPEGCVDLWRADAEDYWSALELRVLHGVLVAFHEGSTAGIPASKGGHWMRVVVPEGM